MRIIKISATEIVTLNGKVVPTVYGLGEDNKIYVWQFGNWEPWDND